MVNCYEKISSLKMNLRKCRIARINNNEDNLHLAEILGCEVEEWPLKNSSFFGSIFVYI